MNVFATVTGDGRNVGFTSGGHSPLPVTAIHSASIAPRKSASMDLQPNALPTEYPMPTISKISAVAAMQAVAATFAARMFTAYLPPIWGYGALAWLRRREYL